MKKNIKNWWDNASLYYQNEFNIPTNDIYYGPFCPTEKKLKIIDTKKIKGKKVLEIGCGGGQSVIFLTKKGAVCSGVDVSKKQIDYAKKLSEKNDVKINYSIGSGDNLHKFKNGEFDIILSIFAIQYIQNLDRCFKEINRVLKRNGHFIFSLDHPFYSVLSPINFKIENRYNYSGRIDTIKTSDIIKKDKWPQGDSQKFVFYFRRISDIYKSLTSSNFMVEEIKEELPDGADNTPWDKIYSKKLANYISPTIIFIAKNL